jgi:M6 family metalloprotease-like protein
MSILNTAVILFAFPLGKQLAVREDLPFYVDYLFSPVDGHAAYWAKQTDNGVTLTGAVFDWAVVDDPNPGINFGSRTDIINAAIASLEADRGVDFGPFDLIVCVVAVPATQATDGGSCSATSRNRSHAGIVTRVGDSFDFLAHETGHALGLNHSYGDPSYKNASWSQPGEYGHPWCIMSARGYGGIGGPYVSASPKLGMSEYNGLGPSLNAATALARGWLDATPYALAGAVPAEFGVRARGEQGRNGQLPPQAVEIIAGDGKTYVVEYREATGWDRGQPSALVIVNGGKGSTADLAHPGTFSATYLGQIPVPFVFGGQGVFNGAGFGVEVLDAPTDSHVVRIRVSPGRVAPSPAVFTVDRRTDRHELVGTGTTIWAPGEKLCVEGAWTYHRTAYWQEAIIDATYPPAIGPVSATWRVDGKPLPDPGPLVLKSKRVQVADQHLANQTDIRTTVTVRYQVEELPTGSRLHLFNDPADETYEVDVTVTISSRVGSAADEEVIRFTGMAYLYPPEMYDQMDACIQRFQHYVRYRVLLPPDLWKRVPESNVEAVRTLVAALGGLHEQGDSRAFEQGRAELERLVGTSVQLTIVPTDDTIHLHGADQHQEPLQ